MVWIFYSGNCFFNRKVRIFMKGVMTTLLKEQFKINTFSLEDYCKRVDAGKLPISLTIRFSLRQRMVYYLFWTAYSTKINAVDFENFLACL